MYTKWIVLFLVSMHFLTAYAVTKVDMHWTLWILICYVIGGTLTHALFLAIHEISHNLAFRSHKMNLALGMFANLPIVAPYSVAFQRYHMDHHKEQGRDGTDTDIPTAPEARFFKGKCMKALWVTMQIMFYAFRPMVVKQFPPTKALCINWMVQFSFDYVVYINFGMTPFYYLGLSALFAGSIHPVAGHFISEHYVFSE